QIRLLELLPEKVDDPLKVKIHTTILNEDTVPEYLALSYVWGSTASPSSIEIVPKRLSVTGNLTTALRYLRAPDGAFIMWVDAVCTNQEDLDKRSQQVIRMRDIYSSARLVVAWLGEADEEHDSVRAMKLLNIVIMQFRGDSASVLHLYYRPWFERVW
ncbi:hypothetical protein M501DRAFT_907101, partial [Patellaria atrata CBS 101060]